MQHGRFADHALDIIVFFNVCRIGRKADDPLDVRPVFQIFALRIVYGIVNGRTDPPHLICTVLIDNAVSPIVDGIVYDVLQIHAAQVQRRISIARPTAIGAVIVVCIHDFRNGHFLLFTRNKPLAIAARIDDRRFVIVTARIIPLRACRDRKQHEQYQKTTQYFFQKNPSFRCGFSASRLKFVCTISYNIWFVNTKKR